MEAPERLYVDTDDRLSDSILYGFTEKRKDDDIEYTRTDALRKEWKPSEEQLNALHDAAVYVDKSMFPYPKGILMKLYKQLKKLREE